MSQECIDLSKIWIVLDQLHFIPYWAKKLGELWSTNQKLIDAHVEPPNWTFSGDYNSPLRWCWPLKFLHTLQLPKMYFKSYLGRRAASCWALPHISSYFFLTRHRISELRRPIAAKLCTVISICVNFSTQVQKLGGFSPKKFYPR